MTTPLPGSPCRGSKTGKPIMALLDLLGRTWALGIVWNVSKQVYTFRELQNLCDGISPTLLNTRLKELRNAQIVEKITGGYALTLIGQELFMLIQPMGTWASQWHRHIEHSKIIANDEMTKGSAHE